MTAAAAATTRRLRGWLSVRHSLGLEAALVVTLYGVYELARGAENDPPKAYRHYPLSVNATLFQEGTGLGIEWNLRRLGHFRAVHGAVFLYFCPLLARETRQRTHDQ